MLSQPVLAAETVYPFQITCVVHVAVFVDLMGLYLPGALVGQFTGEIHAQLRDGSLPGDHHLRQMQPFRRHRQLPASPIHGQKQYRRADKRFAIL